MLMKTENYPDDFHVILCDIMDEIYDHEFNEVIVDVGLIKDHFEELDEEQLFWSQYDFDKVNDYIESVLLGDRFPPLIASKEKGSLRDGYHRLYAYRFAGIVTAEFIYIDRQCAIANYHETQN